MHAAQRRSPIAGLRLRRSTSQPASMTAVEKPRTTTSGWGFMLLSVDLVEPACAGASSAAGSALAESSLALQRRANLPECATGPVISRDRETPPKTRASYIRGACQVKFADPEK